MIDLVVWYFFIVGFLFHIILPIFLIKYRYLK